MSKIRFIKVEAPPEKVDDETLRLSEYQDIVNQLDEEVTPAVTK